MKEYIKLRISKKFVDENKESLNGLNIVKNLGDNVYVCHQTWKDRDLIEKICKIAEDSPEFILGATSYYYDYSNDVISSNYFMLYPGWGLPDESSILIDERNDLNRILCPNCHCLIGDDKSRINYFYKFPHSKTYPINKNGSSQLYVSAEFREKMENQGLTGYYFEDSYVRGAKTAEYFILKPIINNVDVDIAENKFGNYPADYYLETKVKQTCDHYLGRNLLSKMHLKSAQIVEFEKSGYDIFCSSKVNGVGWGILAPGPIYFFSNKFIALIKSTKSKRIMQIDPIVII